MPHDNFENWKAIFLFVTSKLKQSVSSVSGKLTTLELLFVENKD